VAVVGSGPAGLSCAWFLGRQGFLVTVFESLPEIGGLLLTGIPTYRLPKDVLNAELRIFRGLPVTFETGKRLGTGVTKADLDRFDAVFLAVGRQASRRLGVKGDDLPGVIEGIRFLRELQLGGGKPVNGRVAIIGGGNTALDCARSALRQGARPIIVYRRTEAEMPAFPDEVAEAREEGVEFMFQAAPVAVLDKGGRAAGLRLAKTEQGAPDASGRRSAVVVKGSEFSLEADAILVAAGEEIDAGPLEGLMPAAGKVLTGGDLAGGGTVSEAIGSGRRAAAAIETMLTGKTGITVDFPASRGALKEVMKVERINTVYFRDATRVPARHADPALRARDFRETTLGYDPESATNEARRCLTCGTCTSCDNCLIFCPDGAIVREGAGYRILHEYCKGCGICAEECPRGAIHIKRVGI